MRFPTLILALSLNACGGTSDDDTPTDTGAPADTGASEDTGAPEDTGEPEDTYEDECNPLVGVNCARFAEAYIKAPNAREEMYFGSTLALDGNTLVIGDTGDSSAATGINGDDSDTSLLRAGAVHVFVRDGATWSRQAYIKPSDTQSQGLFGHSVAIDGDTLLVGSPWRVNASSTRSGGAYVFTRTGTTWREQAILEPEVSDENDEFGDQVAIDGDTLAVGSFRESSTATGIDGDQTDNNASYAGAVYVYTLTAGDWSQQAYVKASNTDAGDRFGTAIALEGDLLAIGSPDEDSSSPSDQSNNARGEAGAVYMFERTGGTWAQQAYIKAAHPGSGAGFGYSLDLSGTTLVVGARGERSAATGIDGDQTDVSAIDAGAAFVFERTGDVWTQQAYIKASNAEAGDYFGFVVQVEDDTLLVSAPAEDGSGRGLEGDPGDNEADAAGAVYLYRRTGGTWEEAAYIKASNTDPEDYSGYAMAFSGNTFAFDAGGDDSASTAVNGDESDNSLLDAGAVYVRVIAP